MLILNSYLSVSRRGLGALILACAALAAAAGPTAGARAEPPVVNDLAAVAKLAREQHVPIFVAFTLKDCPYCARARREYWTPMHDSAAWRAKMRMAEIVLDGESALRDFSGAATTVRAFAQRFNVRHVPTVIVFDTQGEPAAEPVVGLTIADFYGAYLERAIEQGLARARESR